MDRAADTGSVKAVPIVLDDGVSSARTARGKSLGMVMTLSNSAGLLVGSHSQMSEHWGSGMLMVVLWRE